MARTSTSLYRAIIEGTFTEPVEVSGEGAPSEQPVEGLLHPRVEAESHFDAYGWEWTRRAELSITRVEGAWQANAECGVTLFDVAGWFGRAGWQYFEIPEGTVLPDSLTVTRSPHISHSRSGRLQGRRHVVLPVARMPLGAYLGALDNLARNAVVRQIELTR